LKNITDKKLTNFKIHRYVPDVSTYLLDLGKVDLDLAPTSTISIIGRCDGVLPLQGCVISDVRAAALEG
jgi:hypothetical protein